MVANELQAAHRLGEAFLVLLKAAQSANSSALTQEMQGFVNEAKSQIQSVVSDPRRLEMIRPKEPVDPKPLLVGARQAAKLLSISPRLLWDISSPRGPLPVVKIGVRTIYSVRDLEAFIESRKARPKV